jgi:hypothetical protein
MTALALLALGFVAGVVCTVAAVGVVLGEVGA